MYKKIKKRIYLMVATYHLGQSREGLSVIADLQKEVFESLGKANKYISKAEAL